ncbi:MAG: MFS transporter [Devosia nanyangense]|uniref:MFS transporter n=1 Tax=Devosia nanyangense TaxID=1228055 RepID=A0A933L7C0_9HYPH|nr:MFS transporter [Devosia nanyangense]
MTDAAPLPLPTARRAALLLALATAIGGSVGPIAIGTGGIVGMSLLAPDQMALATVPVSTYVVGSAAASIPAALSMRRLGRRTGFMLGASIGALGAALAATAIILHVFWFFALAMVLLGAGNAFGQQYRFAAADAAEPSFKARAIAWVMAGGVVTGVLGPQVAINARPLVPGVPLAGPFLTLVVLLIVTIAILSRLVVPPPPPITAGTAPGRPLTSLLFRPKFLIALLSAVASYALMSLVMTATPLAMIEHHHSQADAQIAIQWHVIAMFAPSFFTGNLIGRFGKSTVAATGLLLIAAAATIALSGTDLWQFWSALILLGIGWNFGFIASTAMVAELYRPEEAFRVQAMNEFILFSVVAAASFSSGGLLVTGGWNVVNLLVYPIVLSCVALIVVQALVERRGTNRTALP